jgi:hypothetical protein
LLNAPEQSPFPSKRIQYEKIEWIKPENHHLLLADLCERTGLDIRRFEIKEIDFLRDTAEITIYYVDTKAIPKMP